MSIAPFHPAPAPFRGEARRARLAVFAAVVGIAAAVLAYAISPGVRHAVGHAAHAVKHTVSNIFDHDHRPDDVRRPHRGRAMTAPGAHRASAQSRRAARAGARPGAAPRARGGGSAPVRAHGP